MSEFPDPLDSDADDVVWAMQTAKVQWKRGSTADAIVWLQRAIDAANLAGDAFRATELAAGITARTDEMVRASIAPPAPPDMDEGGDDVDDLMSEDTALSLDIPISMDSFGDEDGLEPAPAPVGDSLPPIMAPTAGNGAAPKSAAPRAGSTPPILAPPAPRQRMSSAPPPILGGRPPSVMPSVPPPPPPRMKSGRPPPPRRNATPELAASSMGPRVRALQDSGHEFNLDEALDSREPDDYYGAHNLPGGVAKPPAAPFAAPPAAVPAPAVVATAPAAPEVAEAVVSSAPPAAALPVSDQDLQAPSETEHVLPASSEADEGVTVEGVRLYEVPGFEDFPEDAQQALANAAVIQELAEEEEVGTFGAALVIAGSVGVMATVSDFAGSVAEAGQVVFTAGSLSEAVTLRVVASSPATRVAIWDKKILDEHMAACPWVADELHAVGDRFQALAGATLGPLGDQLDDSLRRMVTDRMQIKSLDAADVVIEAGKSIPGLHVLGAGYLELVDDSGEVVDEVGMGDLVFASDVLSGTHAPYTARAGEGGALILFMPRMDCHELMLSVPPLMEILVS